MTQTPRHIGTTLCEVLAQVSDRCSLVGVGGSVQRVLQVLLCEGGFEGVHGLGSEKAELELVHAVRGVAHRAYGYCVVCRCDHVRCRYGSAHRQRRR